MLHLLHQRVEKNCASISDGIKDGPSCHGITRWFLESCLKSQNEYCHCHHWLQNSALILKHRTKINTVDLIFFQYHPKRVTEPIN